ncbi:hypothetical protein [Lentilactobacillus parabuchneri]|uniref:hypothetical protein n=1 Tax=Lentilactobacillus parabuchneri TaxID=152331 RepID=UPI000A11BF05|nr:hypothetical protein [Lentilactobacillus parabuchneri]ORN33519.1 hypothetical protein FAM23280_01123 [Lentilactobacillus parabuchneri]ORN34105.1 hypothetical protein FAM23279_01157 [Lentilactobacillus parabuchneri]ORN37306.1 hypothetical protein FAM23281_01157 [Lentilactobacillus parabuchneri]
MAIELKPEQVKQLKEQLAEANRNSHFVIISAISKKEHSGVDMVTDWNNYLNMKSTNGDNFDFRIIRDILPITDNLVYWAVAQQNLHSATVQGDQDEQAVDDLEFYTGKIMEENKVRA